MLKKSLICQSIALAMALPGISFAEIEISGYLKNETAVFLKDGPSTGELDSMVDTTSGHDAGDLLKFENSARLFLNGDLGENSTWHGDLNFIYDTEGVNDDYKGHRLYTQHDWLRELYIDTTMGNWDVRVGKQQLVWGTADGIKLLDIINPTDFRELNQNTMEDARIPIWMLKAETDVGDNSNFQLVASQVKENVIPGLNANGDAGHPFLMKGVEAITGSTNGFLSIAPALSKVAGTFSGGALLGGFAATGAPPSAGLTPFTGLTVEGFARNMVDTVSAPGQFLLPGLPGYNAANAAPGYVVLNNLAQNGFGGGDPNGNNYVTNLMPVTGTGMMDTSWDSGNATSAFEYMSNATFATFNSFANCIDGNGGGCDNLYHPLGNPTGTDFLTGGVATQYVQDHPGDSNLNAGFRFKQNLDNGFNYSLNYFHHYSANPQINLSWHDAVTGAELTAIRAAQVDPGTGDYRANPDPNAGLAADAVPNNVTLDAFGNATNSTTMLLFNPNTGAYYGPVDPSTGALNTNPNGSVLRFTESLYRVNSIGASFDYALDTSFAPVVIRGEFLYDNGEKQPIVDKRLLAIGDLTNALKMEDADMFKYVIGVDVTVLRNMMVSGQFIQFRNLDYVDESRTCTTQFGVSYDCSKYSGDFPTLSLSNGMNKGYENKEFYSLFFSKPFGDSDEHRWNNITIYEEGDGWWNRFDVEYSFSDELIGTFEWNQYWGDEDSTFGQFEKSSNLQLGVKYIFE